MAEALWRRKDMNSFQEAVQSLKLYRRAELIDPDVGTSLIDSLYVDPLPAEQIFQTVKRAHTTFLIGRKGTGKSTIFQRLQSELRKSNHQTSAYIDIKTVFESSQIDSDLILKLQNIETSMPPESIEKLLLYKNFLLAIIQEIKNELKKRVSASILGTDSRSFSGNISDLEKALDELYLETNQDKFISVLGIKNLSQSDKAKSLESSSASSGINIEASATPKAEFNTQGTNTTNKSSETQSQYSDILIRFFSIKEFINKLKDLLSSINIRHLHILIDDFSELPEETMKIVVDVLLAPLNNWSDEFIKFKVAAYPGRIYYGEIDKTKIDEVYLDLFKLYGSGDVARMEESAIDFTRRLVEHRISHFCKRPISDFYEGNADEIWKILFYASMANARTLGYILHFIQDSHLIRNKKFNISAIQEASERFYSEKIESYFAIGKFLHESFNERASIFHFEGIIGGSSHQSQRIKIT